MVKLCRGTAEGQACVFGKEGTPAQPKPGNEKVLLVQPGASAGSLLRSEAPRAPDLCRPQLQPGCRHTGHGPFAGSCEAHLRSSSQNREPFELQGRGTPQETSQCRDGGKASQRQSKSSPSTQAPSGSSIEAPSGSTEAPRQSSTQPTSRRAPRSCTRGLRGK